MIKLIKSFIPPILFEILKKIINKKYGWKGNYSTWVEATNDSTGYNTDKIFEAVKVSSLKVKNGEAVCERDSVIFDHIQYSWPLLAGLMYVAAKSEQVKVCDFGGSLGSTYYQNKKFLDEFNNVSWSIVEQKHFVDFGKKEFEDHKLKFYSTIDECIEKEKPNLLLLSSVLQYIEEPYKFIEKILENDFKYIIIDRTPFSKLDEIIKLQIVPPFIYEASYPCWFFNEKIFIKYFETIGYRILEKFDALDDKSDEFYFKGFILKKNEKI